MKRLLFLSALAACTDEVPPLDLANCESTDVYRITEVELATSNELARALSNDLDNDRTNDNQLGQVQSTVQGLIAVDFTARANAQLANGVEWRLTVKQCGGQIAAALTRDDSEPAQYLTDAGDNPYYLLGTGIDVPVAALFDGLGLVTDPGWLSGDRSIIHLANVDSPDITATIATALDAAGSFDAVTETLTPVLDELFPDTDLRTSFDTDGDGQLSLAEIRANSLTQSLLSPDIQLAPDRNGLSYGMRIRGIRE